MDAGSIVRHGPPLLLALAAALGANVAQANARLDATLAVQREALSQMQGLNANDVPATAVSLETMQTQMRRVLDLSVLTDTIEANDRAGFDAFCENVSTAAFAYNDHISRAADDLMKYIEASPSAPRANQQLARFGPEILQASVFFIGCAAVQLRLDGERIAARPESERDPIEPAMLKNTADFGATALQSLARHIASQELPEEQRRRLARDAQPVAAMMARVLPLPQRAQVAEGLQLRRDAGEANGELLVPLIDALNTTDCQATCQILTAALP